MATPPEPLRLFEPDVSPDGSGARARGLSRGETPAPNETQSELSRRAALDRLAAAAHEVDRAGAELDRAIRTARAAGHSWRSIAAAARCPHQTLHRRFETEKRGARAERAESL